MIFDRSSTVDFFQKHSLEKLLPLFFENAQTQEKSANFGKLENLLREVPEIKAREINFDLPAIKIGDKTEISEVQRKELTSKLKKFKPWRKGPFDLLGIRIDAEWRSDMKWARVENEIADLKNRKILDVGCGNGYYMLRMLGKKAEFVLGVEPYLLSVAQFALIKKFIPELEAEILPAGIEALPDNMKFFDTVFSMGVFYHRRSPFEHLFRLRNLLREGGEVVLETLVIEGKAGEVLVPVDRYAKMRNVWFIPSALTLENWLKRAKFKNVRLINVTKTTNAEQRKTEWMDYESLEDFLDENNPDLTVEGYPAPKRAVFIAEAP